MTPQEQQMLDGLIGRVQNTQLAGKDAEAEQRIQQALGSNPDALYVLCQTVLVQGYALEQATQQLAAAKQQLSQAHANAGNHPGFLEKIFGSSQPAPAPSAPATQASYGAPVYSTPGYPPPGYAPQGYPQQYPPQGYGSPMGGGFGGGGGGFLQGALQTAAGVAMGEIAVQSLEGLMHGFGREAGYGSDRAMGNFDGGRDFADNSGSASDLGTGDSYGDRLANSDGANDGLSSDIEDRRGDARGFMGDDDAGGNGDAFADDGGDSGDMQQDDSYGGDDSGGGSDDSY